MKSEKYTKGMAVRREVLGDEYVDKAINAAVGLVRPVTFFEKILKKIARSTKPLCSAL